MWWGHGPPPPLWKIVAADTGAGGRRCYRAATGGPVFLAAAAEGRAMPMIHRGWESHVLRYVFAARVAPPDAPGRLHRAGPGARRRPPGHRHPRLGAGEESPGRQLVVAVRRG